MPRIAFKMKLHPGRTAEYKKRHDQIDGELKALLKSVGIADYSIFLDEGTLDLFAVLDIDDPARLDELPKHAVMKRWWARMRDIMDTNADNSPIAIPLKEMFYLP